MLLATINAIWIGPGLGKLHIACLRSFLMRGHRVVLHVCEYLEDTPEGVELADANELLPRSRMFREPLIWRVCRVLAAEIALSGYAGQFPAVRKPQMDVTIYALGSSLIKMEQG